VDPPLTYILGTTIRTHHCGHATHWLPDELVLCGLLEQLCGELGTTWYCCIAFKDGRQAMRGMTPQSPEPDAEVTEAMLRVSAKLNRDLHLCGCWFVAWHRQRLVLGWRDWDGDLGFMLQFDEPWSRIRNWTLEEYCQRAEGGFAEFREMIRSVELTDEHTIKRAQGQQSATRH
jgi:hypothetical protein